MGSSIAAAWVQAIGSVLAVVFAVFVAWWEHRRTMNLKKEESERLTRAQGILVESELETLLELLARKIELAESFRVLPLMMTEGPIEFEVGIPYTIREMSDRWGDLSLAPKCFQKLIYQCKAHGGKLRQEHVEWSQSGMGKKARNIHFTELALYRLRELDKLTRDSQKSYSDCFQ